MCVCYLFCLWFLRDELGLFVLFLGQCGAVFGLCGLWGMCAIMYQISMSSYMIGEMVLRVAAVRPVACGETDLACR